jgi:3-oxoadipate enol-lactonase
MKVAVPAGTLTIRTFGPDHGRPVVLLHPLASSGELWAPVASWLGEHGYRSLAPDLPASAAPAGRPLTVQDMAGDVAYALDQLGLTSVSVAGMSMGGCTAQALALARPDLVNALVLADTTSDYGPDRVSQWNERAVAAETKRREELIDFQLQRWFTEDFRRTDPAECQRVVDLFLATTPEVHAACSRALGAFTAASDIHRITAGTLVLVGEQDYATPVAMARTLAETIPGAELRVLPATMHLSMIESRAAREALLAHLDQVAARTAGAGF